MTLADAVGDFPIWTACLCRPDQPPRYVKPRHKNPSGPNLPATLLTRGEALAIIERMSEPSPESELQRVRDSGIEPPSNDSISFYIALAVGAKLANDERLGAIAITTNDTAGVLLDRLNSLAEKQREGGILVFFRYRDRERRRLKAIVPRAGVALVLEPTFYLCNETPIEPQRALRLIDAAELAAITTDSSETVSVDSVETVSVDSEPVVADSEPVETITPIRVLLRRPGTVDPETVAVPNVTGPGNIDPEAPGTPQDTRNGVGDPTAGTSGTAAAGLPNGADKVAPDRLADQAAPEPAPVTVTLFADLAARTCVRETLTLAAFAARIDATKAPSKETLPLLKLAKLGAAKSAGGSLGHNANIEALTGIEVEHDGEEIGFDAAVAVLRERDIETVAYTSPSHRLNGHGDRWRICAFFERDHLPEERERYVNRLAGLFRNGDATLLAPESWVSSQAYYFGQVGDNLEHRAVVTAGLRLDHPSFDALDATALPKPGRPDGNGGDDGIHETGGDPEAPIDDIIAALAIIPNDFTEWNRWNTIGLAVYAASGGAADGYTVFALWSEQNPAFDATETERMWTHMHRSPPTRSGYGSLVFWAREHDPDFVPPSQRDDLGGDDSEEGPGISIDETAQPQPQAEPSPGPRGPQPQAQPSPGPKPASTDVINLGEWDFGAAKIDPKTLPPRGWLLGIWLCRQFLSSLFGDGAVGKTAFRIACALALAADNDDILKERVFEPCRVLFLCFEDGETELKRRICAAMLHHQISDADIEGRLFVKAISNSQLKLAVSGNKRGKVSRGPLHAALVKAIERRAADVVILDPLIKIHTVDENNNAMMDIVADMLVEFAVKYNIAVDVPHHVAKGSASPGNADAGRGASAIKDGGRLIYTLTPMSEWEAALYRIRPSERLEYVRIDPGKVNLVRRATAKTKWLHLVNVELDNGDEIRPNGDAMQTVEAWYPPELLEGLSGEIINRMLDQIHAGPAPGQRYSAKAQATARGAWRVVTELCPEVGEARAKAIIRDWCATGVLVEGEYDDRGEGKSLWGVTVGQRPKWGTQDE
jgi:hypothetical protein